MNLLLWMLGSLIVISLIGDHPYVALALAVLAGIAFGLNTFIEAGGAGPQCADASTLVEENARRRLIVRHGWMIDVVATALLIFPTKWMVLGFVLVLISWLLRWVAHRHIIPRTLFNVPLLALMFMILVSLWASADLDTSLVPLGQLVAGINAYYAIADRVQTENALYWLTAGMIALGVFIALLAPFGVTWTKGKIFSFTAVYGHFLQVLPKGIHPNQLAGALVLTIPIATAVLLVGPLRPFSLQVRRVARALLVIGLVLMLIVLLLTQSRGGIVAMVAGMMILLAFKGRWMFGSALAALAGLALFVFTRLDIAHAADLFFSTDAISGLAGREEVWSRAIYALQDVPYTGIGLGIFARALKVLYPLFLAGPDADVPHAHNLYLQVGVDLGIPGLVAYLAIMVLGLVAAWHVFASARGRRALDLGAIALGWWVALIAILLHGLVDVVVWDSKSAILVWVLLGMIARAYDLEFGTRGTQTPKHAEPSPS